VLARCRSDSTRPVGVPDRVSRLSQLFDTFGLNRERGLGHNQRGQDYCSSTRRHPSANHTNGVVLGPRVLSRPQDREDGIHSTPKTAVPHYCLDGFFHSMRPSNVGNSRRLAIELSPLFLFMWRTSSRHSS